MNDVVYSLLIMFGTASAGEPFDTYQSATDCVMDLQDLVQASQDAGYRIAIPLRQYDYEDGDEGFMVVLETPAGDKRYYCKKG